MRIERERPKVIIRTLNLEEFFRNRNKILIVRGIGGLGDILMHRMIFKNIKDLMPDVEIHFGCPSMYHDALIDHPYLDKIISHINIDKSEYVVHYNTTTACGKYEMRLAPFSGDHRSDIWANHCGITLHDHDMYINLTDEEKKYGLEVISKIKDRSGPNVVICPISAMHSKNLLPHQLDGVIAGLYDRNCFVFGVHSCPIDHLIKRNIPCLHGLNIRQWMGLINAADYIISVDTSSFHCAGGMKKPVVGVFTFADGRVYGKHYPKFELVQKHRDLDILWTCGPCYNWGACPKSKDSIKPCLTEITSEMILAGVDKLFERFPLN